MESYLLAILALLNVAASILLLSVALDTGNSLTDKVRLESVDIVAQRFGSSIYMMSGLEEGRTQLNLRDDYGIDKRDGQVFLNYTVDYLALSVLEKKEDSPVNAPVDFSAEEGISESFCLVKKPGSDVEIKAGEC